MAGTSSTFRRASGARATRFGSRSIWVGVNEVAEVEADAQLQQRLGALLPGGEDRWWEIEAETDTAALAAELRDALEARALPWLDARASLDQLIALAREAPNDFPRYALGRFQILLQSAGLEALASDVRL